MCLLGRCFLDRVFRSQAFVIVGLGIPITSAGFIATILVTVAGGLTACCSSPESINCRSCGAYVLNIIALFLTVSNDTRSRASH